LYLYKYDKLDPNKTHNNKIDLARMQSNLHLSPINVEVASHFLIFYYLLKINLNQNKNKEKFFFFCFKKKKNLKIYKRVADQPLWGG
jgi:hypothetical protein